MGEEAETARRSASLRPVAWSAGQWRIWLIGAAALLGIIGRVTYGWTAPFWFDETFTGVIATQPSFRGLIAWCLTELSGPAFYVPLWLWEKLAGSSDAALRAPSVFLSLAAPLLIYWKGHPDRDVRLFWAIVVLLWLPAMTAAAEARPYPQLFFLATAQAIAFLNVMHAPGRSRMFLWTSVTALMILTNYYALLISGIQGVIYLIRHRRVALSTWPAALPLLAVAAWMAVHLPFVLTYTKVVSKAYNILPWSQLTLLPGLLFGITLYGTIILVTIAVTQAMAVRAAGRPRAALLTPDRLLALSGAIAFLLIFATAFLRPGFAPRYLTPCMPALLFGVALWARAQLRRDVKPLLIVFALMFVMTAGVIRSNLTEPDGDARHRFNLEEPSSWLGERKPDRLIYFYDGPIAAILSPGRVAEVGGFFFRRSGESVSVTALSVPQGKDPSRVLLAAAGDDRGAVILWLAGNREPHISALDKRWECRDFGGGQITNTACRRRT